MAEPKKEHPKGLRSMEMILIEMLQERRSWVDYQTISSALWRIRHTADQMRKEQEILFPKNEAAGSAGAREDSSII